MSQEKCQCAASGFCTRRNAHVPRSLWRQCRGGAVDRVDDAISAIRESRKRAALRHEQRAAGWEAIDQLAAAKREQQDSPQPRAEWPTWAVALARIAKPQDTGVGDTAQRIAAKLGGESFKWLAKKLGIPCGCTARQAQWNTRYPYEQAPSQN